MSSWNLHHRWFKFSLFHECVCPGIIAINSDIDFKVISKFLQVGLSASTESAKGKDQLYLYLQLDGH